MLLKDQFYIRHSFLEGDSNTIGLAGGTGTDTFNDDRIAVHLDKLSKAVVSLQQPVNIMQDFNNLFFDCRHR